MHFVHVINVLQDKSTISYTFSHKPKNMKYVTVSVSVTITVRYRGRERLRERDGSTEITRSTVCLWRGNRQVQIRVQSRGPKRFTADRDEARTPNIYCIKLCCRLNFFLDGHTDLFDSTVISVVSINVLVVVGLFNHLNPQYFITNLFV